MFICGSRGQMKAGLKLERGLPKRGAESDPALAGGEGRQFEPLPKHHTTRLHRDPPI